ncbi:MAG: FHA domain-containing protein [Albidovulum sp.]
MGLLGRLIGWTKRNEVVVEEPRDVPAFPPEGFLVEIQKDYSEAISSSSISKAGEGRVIAEPDMSQNGPAEECVDEDITAELNVAESGTDVQTSEPVEASPPIEIAAASARKRRTKTRLIGFDKSDGRVVDLFDQSTGQPSASGPKFPVGWIVVVDGPGTGECFNLQAGMSQIGRGDDQAIQLDFGDAAISRTNHAAVVYDPETHQFILGHGGKSNIVRLNDKPLISNETLKNGDLIRIGETTLRLAALCNEKFNWANDNNEESTNVEIA